MILQDIRSQIPLHPDPNYRYRVRKLAKIKIIVLHCDNWDADVQVIADYDIKPNHISDKGCPGFTYHYFVEKDDRVLWCMDDSLCTWHAGDYNGESLGVCLRYIADNNPKPPPDNQLATAMTHMVTLCLKYGIDPDNVFGHRELLGSGYIIEDGKRKLKKTCPGLLVNMDLVRYNIALAIQTQLGILGLYKGKLDGMFGPVSEAALKEYVKLSNHA